MPEDRSKQFNEMFMCISYSKLNQTLSAGTNLGQIYFWIKKQTKTDYIDNPEETWTLTNINNVSGTIKQLMWGSVNLRLPLIAVNCVTKVYILKEQSLSVCFSENIWATQNTASQILLETSTSNYTLKTDIQVTNMSLNTDYLSITNNRIINVYAIYYKNKDIAEDNKTKERFNISTTLLSTFTCDNEQISMYGKNIFVLTKQGVVIRSPNGLNIGCISIVPAEGEPIGISLTNHFLTIFTIDGYVKLFDVSVRDTKLVTPIRSIYDMCSDFGEIIHAKSNSVGNKIAFTIATANLIPDGKLYIWDVETDLLLEYDFRKGQDSNVEEKTEGNEDYAVDIHVDFDKVCVDRIPLSICWDSDDPRLLVCDAKKLKSNEVNPLKITPLLRQKSSKS